MLKSPSLKREGASPSGREGLFTDVRYEPSRLRPRTVVADVDVELFLGNSFQRTKARAEVLWWPQEGTDVQRVHWADDVVNLGWHKDDEHPDLGTTRFQLEAGDEVVHEPGYIEVEAPLSFLEICLDRLPEELQQTNEY